MPIPNKYSPRPENNFTILRHSSVGVTEGVAKTDPRDLEINQLIDEVAYLKAKRNTGSQTLVMASEGKNNNILSSKTTRSFNLSKNASAEYTKCEGKYLNDPVELNSHFFTSVDLPPFVDIHRYLQAAHDVLEIGCGNGLALLQTQSVKQTTA